MAASPRASARRCSKARVYDKRRPARDRELHGLLHAARRRPAVLRGRHDRDAVPVQPARHQGLRRGGRHRRAAGGHQRDHRRARPRGHRHAGDAAGRLARRAEGAMRRWRRNESRARRKPASAIERPCTLSTYHRPTTRRGRPPALLAKAEDAKLLAGGQTLLPTMKQRLAAPATSSISAASRSCAASSARAARSSSAR